MVIPPPVRPERVTKHWLTWRNKCFLHAQEFHTPTATVASSASSQEKALQLSMEQAKESTRDVAAAAKIGKILGERLLLRNIPSISLKEQRYQGKVRAVID